MNGIGGRSDDEELVEPIGSVRITAPWIVDAPMNSRIFETWIETQLVPTLLSGDVVFLDNVGFLKCERAEKLVKAKGA